MRKFIVSAVVCALFVSVFVVQHVYAQAAFSTESKAFTLNPGDIIVADQGNNFETRIVRIDPVTGTQMIVAQGGILGASLFPRGVAIDTSGNILVSNMHFADQSRIVKVNPVTGEQTLLTSGVFLQRSFGIAVEPNGTILVVALDNALGPDGLIQVDPISGTQKPFSIGGFFGDPRGIAIATNGDILVANDNGEFPSHEHDAVIRVDPLTGVQTRVSSSIFFSNVDGDPTGIAIATNGDIIVSDISFTGGIIRVNPETGVQTQIASRLAPGTLINTPVGIAIDANDDIIVADVGASKILRVDPTTGAQTIVAQGGNLIAPFAIAIVPVQKNTSPTLSFPATGPYAGDGIDPNKGTANSTLFSFKVVYTDADNNPPSDITLVVDDGSVPTRYNMLALDEAAADTLRDQNYTNGEQYSFGSQFSKGQYLYHFEASDGKGGNVRLPETGGFPLVITPSLIEVPIMVTLDRMQSGDSDGCGDPLGEPDFYPKIRIGDEEFTKPAVNDTRDLSTEAWLFSKTVMSKTGSVPIHIELWDDDLFGDDQCDINPSPDKNSLDIIYDGTSGVFSGDSTKAMKLITNSSGDGKNKADLCFGISDSGHIAVCDLRPIQVVYDSEVSGDGIIDMVNNKPAAVFVIGKNRGFISPDLPISYEFLINGSVVNELNTLNNKILISGQQIIPFTPTLVGNSELEVRVEQEDSISIIKEAVTVKETLPLVAPYVRIDQCGGDTYCYGPTTQYTSAITLGNRGVVSQFPIAPANFHGVDSGRLLEGNPDRTESDELKTVFAGMLDDVKNVYKIAKRVNPRTDVGIGVVPSDNTGSGYFRYFGFTNDSRITFGVQIGNVRGVLVTDDPISAVAHEVVHVYDVVQHRADQTSGYYADKDILIKNAENLMCSGQCGVSNPPDSWIDKETYEKLFAAFLKDKKDPELLLLSGTIFADGSVKFDEWYKIDEGIPTQLSGKDYTFSFVGLDGSVLDSVSYNPSFSIHIDPIGTFDIGAAPFSFAVPYPNEFVSKIVLSRGDRILASIDPNAKLLRDAISLVPYHGFVGPPDNRRATLLQKIDAWGIILERGDNIAAIKKLKDDIRVHIVEWLADYTTQSPLQLSKVETIKLIDYILVALQNNSK